MGIQHVDEVYFRGLGSKDNKTEVRTREGTRGVKRPSSYPPTTTGGRVSRYILTLA